MSKILNNKTIITDLDQSDEEQPKMQNQNHKKILNTIQGNFNRRSRSTDRFIADNVRIENLGKTTNKKAQSYFNELLQAKEKQMEKLMQRLLTLHKFNEQFANENQQLREDLKLVEQQIVDLRKQIDDCERCKTLTQKLNSNNDENKVLHSDVIMLKTLVYRLNVQIEYYQDCLRKHKDENYGKEKSLPPPLTTFSAEWQETPVHLHTLSPLLQSYDEILREKEQLIQQYRKEFENFTGEFKRIVEENSRLAQQFETFKRDVSNWREERTRLQTQLEVCRSKVEVHAKKSDLAKEKLVEVMHCYEQKTQTLMLDIEHLQNAYGRCKAELASYKSLPVQHQETITKSLSECKALLEQLKQEHNKEKIALEKSIEEMTEKRAENLAKIETLNQNNILLKNELERYNTELVQIRKSNETLEQASEKIKRSRDRLKGRLRVALEWTQKLESGQTDIQNTWDAIKRLETIVKHRESQLRGLNERYVEEMDKMEKKLAQKEETIRTILRGKLSTKVNT